LDLVGFWYRERWSYDENKEEEMIERFVLPTSSTITEDCRGQRLMVVMKSYH
jgi:hypothetical protein